LPALFANDELGVIEGIGMTPTSLMDTDFLMDTDLESMSWDIGTALHRGILPTPKREDRS